LGWKRSQPKKDGGVREGVMGVSSAQGWGLGIKQKRGGSKVPRGENEEESSKFWENRIVLEQNGDSLHRGGGVR